MQSAPAPKACKHIFSPATTFVIAIAFAGTAIGLEPRNSAFDTDSFPKATQSNLLSSQRGEGFGEFSIEGFPTLNQPEIAQPPGRVPATDDMPPLALPSPNDPADILLSNSLRPLSKISLDVLPRSEGQPGDYYLTRNIERNAKPYATTGNRFDTRREFHWEASNLIHKPLYFEDVALERHGQSYPPLIQPVVSVGAFLFSAASLPYRMDLDPPSKTIYTLGYERPGDYTPPVMGRIPFSARAAITQAGAIVSGSFLFP